MECLFAFILLLTFSRPISVSSASLEYSESINPPVAPLGLQGYASRSHVVAATGGSTTSRGRGRPQAISRPTDITESESLVIVDTHNTFRREVSPSSGNMNALVWDEDLAAMAQGWSDQCYFAHGNPENSAPFASVGQNVYIRWMSKRSPPAPTPETPVRKWHSEGDRFTYEPRRCRGVCGHYTQIVWAHTTHIGCGKTFCEMATNPKGKKYTNAWIVTCNYGPAGNYRGQMPYLRGEACSRCSNPSTCRDGLCGECDLGEQGCSCDLVCENCGLTNTTNGACSCSCPNGFWGNNCERICEDTHRHCGVSPGWPSKRYCNRHPGIPKNCPLMCGICERADADFVCDMK